MQRKKSESWNAYRKRWAEEMVPIDLCTPEITPLKKEANKPPPPPTLGDRIQDAFDSWVAKMPGLLSIVPYLLLRRSHQRDSCSYTTHNNHWGSFPSSIFLM